jgi:hypothetical protein
VDSGRDWKAYAKHMPRETVDTGTKTAKPGT